MKFDGRKPTHRDVLDRFLAEFETIWNSSMTVDAWKGRKLAERIVRTLENQDVSYVRGTIERRPGMTIDQLVERLKRSRSAIASELGKLVAANLVKMTHQGDELSFELTD
ncbi:MAG TPA: hypothetical protein PKO06_23130 [Candidatus Ozemobacteraceae bacterium]|nr:hypothetical protein [Candidatus Ozemobacteraceae bacterium]